MNDAQVVLNSQNELGEGPLWSAREQALYWVDIKKQTLYRYQTRDNHFDQWQFGVTISAVSETDRPGRLLVAGRGSLFLFDVDSQDITQLSSYEGDLPYNRPNDGKTDPQGRFWFGTTDDRELAKTGSLYRFDGDLQLTKIRDNMGIPNTFAWSPDRRTFYIADSVEQTMYAYQYNAITGEIDKGREFFSLKETEATPDGSAVDSEGYLWNAQWMGWRVVRYAPDGSVDRVVELPVACPTSCMFGGEDYKTLYVTSARKGQTEDMLADQPLAGALFSIRCEVPGLPEPVFAIDIA